MKRRSMLYISSAALLGCLARVKGEERAEDPINSAEVLKRLIPSSGQALPVVGLGTWRVFDAGSSAQRRSPLKNVLENLVAGGGSVIDSSPMYGSSESVVGDLSAELKNRSSLFLATKVWTTGRQEGIDQMNRSFEKLKTGSIDLMQVHNLVDAAEHFPVLREWKKAGRIKYIGITHYLASAYPEMMQYMRKDRPDFIQCNYNIASREAEKELFPLAKELGMAIIINRPFAEGALLKQMAGKPLPQWAAEYGIESWAQFLLKYIVSNPVITCVIPGTSNPAHMKENLLSATGSLPDENTRRKMVAYFESL